VKKTKVHLVDKTRRYPCLEAKEDTYIFKILNLIKKTSRNTTKTMVMIQVEDRKRTTKKIRRTLVIIPRRLQMMIKMLRN
jgi:hypothetical protein